MDTALSAEVQVTGYNWNDIQNDSPDVLASKVVQYGKCLEYDTEAWLEELGGACITQNKLKLMPCSKRDFAKGSYASSIAIANGKVEVFAPQSVGTPRYPSALCSDFDNCIAFLK